MNVITTADGKKIDLDSVAQTLVYNGDATLQYTQVAYRGSDYRQTFGYTTGKVTSISMWIKQ